MYNNIRRHCIWLQGDHGDVTLKWYEERFNTAGLRLLYLERYAYKIGHKLEIGTWILGGLTIL